MTTSWAVLVVALWCVVAILIALVLGLSRRVRELSDGQLLASGQADANALGPAVGSVVELQRARDGQEVGDADAERLENEGRVVLFMSSQCGPCHQLSERIAVARSDGFSLDGTKLVVVTDEGGPGNYAGIRPDHVIVQDPPREVEHRLGVRATPFGLALGADGSVKWSGVPNTMEDIEAMASTLDGNGKVDLVISQG